MTSVAANGAGPRHEILVDAALALPLAALAIGGTAGELASATAPTPPPVGGYLIALAAAATLMWRRQRPAVVAVAALAIAACYPLIGYPGWAPMLPMFVALFSLSAYGATQRALYGALGPVRDHVSAARGFDAAVVAVVAGGVGTGGRPGLGVAARRVHPASTAGRRGARAAGGRGGRGTGARTDGR